MPLDPNGDITGYLVTWLMTEDDKNDSVHGTLNQKLLGANRRSLLISDLGKLRAIQEIG